MSALSALICCRFVLRSFDKTKSIVKRKLLLTVFTTKTVVFYVYIQYINLLLDLTPVWLINRNASARTPTVNNTYEFLVSDYFCGPYLCFNKLRSYHNEL